MVWNPWYTGYGEHSYDNGKYEGYWEGGKRHGQGTYTWPEGDKYVGEWQNEVREGWGTYTFPNGNKYEGQWKGGYMEGHGTFTYVNNGGEYVGAFRNDNVEGTGTRTWPSGEKYVGQWRNNVREGQGTHTFSDGNEYEGQWKGDKTEGHGTFTWANGDEYVGQWKGGKREGHGTFTWPSGDKYVGAFRNGKREGKGSYTWANGNKYEGRWKGDKMEGRGAFTWADGSTYNGEWKKNKKHGHGLYSDKHGQYFHQVWENGKRTKHDPLPKSPLSRYIAFDEPDDDSLGLVRGVFDDDKNPIVSIDNAVESLPLKLSDFLWLANIFVNKEEIEDKMKKYPGLTKCMVAAIYLYTSESPLYKKLNELLRMKDRSKLRGTPGNSYFPYIRLLFSALRIVSSSEKTMVNRGVPCIKMVNRGVPRNLVAKTPEKYAKGKMLMWWSFSSCTSDIAVLENPQFLGTHGDRTIFQIHTSKSVNVQDFSALPSEAERLLPAGCAFNITGLLTMADGLTIVTLEDAEAPPLIE